MKHTPKDLETGLKRSYVAGLAASTAKARRAHWNKTKKMDPKNQDAYTPAPGDKGTKTKESKYTKKYREKFGEGIEMEEIKIDEEVAAGLSKKATQSGISIETLRKVYQRGVAAWRTGHRPGTTPQQWGMARVNSYITKGKTYHTADKDLHEKAETPTAEPQSADKNKSSSRFDATSSLDKIYRQDTPGQKGNTLKTIKDVVREALYHGREVPLNKPMKGDVKKSKVFVKDPQTGNIKKVNFGDKKLSIKKNIPARKKSYCARSSGQGNLTDKTSANYWSRRAWSC